MVLIRRNRDANITVNCKIVHTIHFSRYEKTFLLTQGYTLQYFNVKNF